VSVVFSLLPRMVLWFEISGARTSAIWLSCGKRQGEGKRVKGMRGTREKVEEERVGVGRGEEDLSRLCKVVWRTTLCSRITTLMWTEQIRFEGSLASESSKRGCKGLLCLPSLVCCKHRGVCLVHFLCDCCQG
jgi:hypothetical protein